MRDVTPKFYMCRGVRTTAAEFEAWLAAQPKHPPVSRDEVATFTAFLRSRNDEIARDLAGVLERHGVVIGRVADLIAFAADLPELARLLTPEEAAGDEMPGMRLYWDWVFAKRRLSSSLRRS